MDCAPALPVVRVGVVIGRSVGSPTEDGWSTSNLTHFENPEKLFEFSLGSAKIWSGPELWARPVCARV